MTYIKTHIFSVLTIVLITVLSLMPAQEFPQVDVQFADKWTHWVMYGFLCTVMGVEAIRTHSKQSTAQSASLMSQFLCILLFCCLWGGLMELGQSYLTTTRHGDWMDALANSFGALCALLALTIYYLTVRRKTNKKQP